MFPYCEPLLHTLKFMAKKKKVIKKKKWFDVKDNPIERDEWKYDKEKQKNQDDYWIN